MQLIGRQQQHLTARIRRDSLCLQVICLLKPGRPHGHVDDKTQTRREGEEAGQVLDAQDVSTEAQTLTPYAPP